MVATLTCDLHYVERSIKGEQVGELLVAVLGSQQSARLSGLRLAPPVMNR